MADSSSGGMTAIVAIVAIILILGVGFFVFRGAVDNGGNGGPSINVDVPTPGAQ
jgi:hypothetical protein